jgi:hypothetical protein
VIVALTWGLVPQASSFVVVAAWVAP